MDHQVVLVVAVQLTVAVGAQELLGKEIMVETLLLLVVLAVAGVAIRRLVEMDLLLRQERVSAVQRGMAC